MNKEQNSQNDGLSLIKVLTSDDGMLGYIMLTKNTEGSTAFSNEQLKEALIKNHINTGINEEVVLRLAQRPIFNLKIKVAQGQMAIAGEDGCLHYLVKRDSEYSPEYNENAEGLVDYKNLNYFQMVKKNQVLCEITKEKEGIDGINIFGEEICAKIGKEMVFSIGKNTLFSEDETKIISSCDGIVRFVQNKLDINDMLHIPSNVDFRTGNIEFSGDVIVDGDVCTGFSVKSDGNIIIRGVVEDAHIEAAGNLHISKGLMGGFRREITVGKDFNCHYIENAILNVKGDISADYIIDSKITCLGNIKLAGNKELINGGEISLAGQLSAKEIGTERERMTKIRIIGIETIDTIAVEKLKIKIQNGDLQLKVLIDKANQLNQSTLSEDEMPMLEKLQIKTLGKQITRLKEQLKSDVFEAKRLENELITEYCGCVIAKRKLHRGVRISFGDNIFQFELASLDRCKIYYDNGEIVQGVL
ncbi:MAG: DUF342 domain-containing protein [Eubacteriaceae bacterium]|nr:DUF342 domain-containing protein [Eubacteriaceae bacterium]